MALESRFINIWRSRFHRQRQIRAGDPDSGNGKLEPLVFRLNAKHVHQLIHHGVEPEFASIQLEPATSIFEISSSPSIKSARYSPLRRMVPMASLCLGRDWHLSRAIVRSPEPH